MNIEVANELYERSYSGSVAYESFIGLLETGLKLAQHHPIGDKLYVNKVFQKYDELKAINIALAYNQEVMVKLLLERN